MKRYFIIGIYFCFINNILAQESKIIYTFPPLVYKALNVGLEDLPAFHDTTNFVIALRFDEIQDTVILRIIEIEKGNSRRSQLPIVERTNRYCKLENGRLIPIFFYSDLHFGQWPMGMLGRYYCIKFSYSGKFYGSYFD